MSHPGVANHSSNHRDMKHELQYDSLSHTTIFSELLKRMSGFALTNYIWEIIVTNKSLYNMIEHKTQGVSLITSVILRWDVITYSCPNSYGDLTNLLLLLGHGFVIHPNVCGSCNYASQVLVHDMICWRHQIETFSRVTGHLCGEITGDRWPPHTKASDAEFLIFSLICAGMNG